MKLPPDGGHNQPERAPDSHASPAPASASEQSRRPTNLFVQPPPRRVSEPAAAVEFDDGTEPPVEFGWWNDEYMAAQLTLDEAQVAQYRNSAEYAYFDAKLRANGDGRLVLQKEDLTSPQRWRTLGFFLSRHPDVHSIRFHGVDLRVDEFAQMTATFQQASIAHPRRRVIEPRTSTDLDSSSSSSSSSSASASASASPASPCPIVGTEWCGGWGVDTDQLLQARRQGMRKNYNLRHLTFIDNAIGVEPRPAASASSSSSSAAAPASSPASSSSPSSNALKVVLLLLLFCELLETAHLERQSLNDAMALRLVQELLLKHPSLRKLSLRWNGVTGKGAEQIAQAIENMHKAEGHIGAGAKTKELDLSYNRIDASTAEKLCRSNPAYECDESKSGSASACGPPSSAGSIARPLPYRVNLRWQMPHSALMLSHFLRLSSVHNACNEPRARAHCAQAAPFAHALPAIIKSPA